MSSSDKKYFGESALSSTPDKRFIIKIKDGSVTTDKIADGAVTRAKIKDGAVNEDKLSSTVYSNLIKPYIDNLQNQISTMSSASGTPLATMFGNNDDITVAQSTLTAAINKIWEKLEDITGETLQGISMVVSPTYFIGEDGCTVTVTANTVETNGVFESIEVTVGGVSLGVETNVTSYSHSTTITETSVVECTATIMGITYTRQAVITHYDAFWVGAGATYTDIMANANLVSVNDEMRFSTDVTCTDGQYIFIVMGENFADGFIRADINGLEIPFTQSTVTVDGVTYRVFKSVNTYQAGTYNIDING